MSKRLESILINKCMTPTAKNGECPFSVGVMNLTEPEANAVMSFARALIRKRSETSDAGKGRLWGRPVRVSDYGSPAWEMRQDDLRNQAFEALVSKVEDELSDTNYRGAPTVAEMVQANEEARERAQRAYLTSDFEQRKTAAAYVASTMTTEDVLTRQQLRDAGLEWSPTVEPEVKPEPARNRFSGLDIE